jgi:hypothetical protein
MKLNNFRFFILITILSGLWLCSNATAQTVPCAMPDPPNDSIIALEKRLLKLKSQFVKNARTSGLTEVQYIPIKAHILRKSDGTGGLSLADLNTALVQVNRHFQNIGLGLQLYFSGLPNIINNTAYYDYNNTDEQALCNVNSVSNAINVYFPNSVRFDSQNVGGYAYFPSTLSISNNLFVQAQVATDNRTFAHELGHYFNLVHTFQNSNNTNNAEREYVTRNPMQGANCTLKGDLVCDTPADPYGRDSVTIQGCTYTGTARDPKGQLYAPSLSNIMSYYPLSCGSDFTPGQSARMADGFLLRTDPSNQYSFSGGSTVTGGNVPGHLRAQLLASGCSLTFDDNSSDEAGFVIERSSISAAEDFVPIGALPPNATNYIDQTITSYTTYYYRVKASNSSLQYSEVLPVSTALNYCIPTYTYPCSTTAVLINEFVLKQGATTIINNKNSNCSPANYGDYTSTAYPVTAGNTYNFTIAQGAVSYYDQHVSVWADFDQDGYFELNERVYRSDSLASMPRMNPTASGSFVIPSSVQGLVRVRVRSGYNFGAGSAVTNPCGLLTFGEAEDYMLQVTSPSPATIITNTVAPSPVCAGDTINVGFTAVNFSTTSYAVQLSDNTGNNFITIPTTTTTGSPIIAVIPANITSGTGYKVRVISNSPSVIGSASSTFTINAQPSSPGVVTPVSYCQGQTASALSAVGTNLRWYLTSVGGFGSSTAPTPSTASSGTLSYWVTQTVNSCESTRTKIDVVVTSTPTSPGVVTPISYCQGQTASALSAVGTNLKWYLAASGGVGSNTAPTPSTASSGTLSYWVTQTVNSCESTRTKIDVVVTATPTSPGVVTPISYCQGQTASALSAVGTNLKWYLAASGGVGSGTAPTPSTASSGTLSYWVSQTVNSCESTRTKIDVVVTATPSPPGVVTSISYCQGQTASALSAVGTNLKWYLAASGGVGSSTAPTPSTASSGTLSYWVSQTVNNCESTRTKINVVVTSTPAPPEVTTPIDYPQGGIASPLSAVGTNLKWYLTASGGIGSTVAPTPSTVDAGMTEYYVTQTVNNCESNRATIQVEVINVVGSSPTTVCLNLALFLEGPYAGSLTMTNKLNQKGLLPGQTPISSLGVPTPAGQPYSGAPWNYSGSETVISYPPNAVDWVLISLRTVAQDPLTTVFRTAALLLSNGSVSLISPCPVLWTNQSYFVVVEHRNHIGVISHQAIPVVNNSINYNFSTQQSYIPVGSPANGQKQLSAGFFVLYAADCTKNSLSQIDANDTSKWRVDNGKVGRYLTTDFNMDGAPDANDNTLWRLNNGRFSGVNFY